MADVPATPWAGLQPEQQAAFLEAATTNGAFNPGRCFERFDVSGCMTGGTPTALDTYLQTALREIRAGRGAP